MKLTYLLLSSVLFFSSSFAIANDSKTEGSVDSEKILADPESIVIGKAKFSSLCAYCHGPEGSGGKARKLQGRDDLTSDYVFTTITNGKKRGSYNMPPWKSLPEDLRWKLTAYILHLSEKGR